MKSSFLQKYKQKIVKVSALSTQGTNPDNFSFDFGRNDDFINSFWNCLTFTRALEFHSFFEEVKTR